MHRSGATVYVWLSPESGHASVVTGDVGIVRDGVPFG